MESTTRVTPYQFQPGFKYNTPQEFDVIECEYYQHSSPSGKFVVLTNKLVPLSDNLLFNLGDEETLWPTMNKQRTVDALNQKFWSAEECCIPIENRPQKTVVIRWRKIGEVKPCLKFIPHNI